MARKRYLSVLLNRLVKKEAGARLRPFFSHPAVFALIKLYYSRAQPFLRRFYPLLGATMMIGLTYKCQCHCGHCGTTAHRDPDRQELSGSEVLDLMRQAAALGAGWIYFFGGEPLLSHGLLRIISAARDLGLGVTLDSNGLMLDRKLARELKESGAERIGISIDSAEETEHDRLRGVPGAWRAAVAAASWCREAGLDVYISTFATRENLLNGGLDRTIELGRSLGVRIRVLSSIRAGRWLERADVSLRPEDVQRLRSRLREDVFWEFIFQTNPEAEFICSSAAKSYFYVSPYGDVQPCAYMPLSFGNFRSEPLSSIARRMWNSAIYSTLDSSLDCPMNSSKFRSIFGEVLSRPGPGPHHIDAVDSAKSARCTG